ncbi:hypothetical protein E2C01_054503 [Portunus trituberculatus]|uniref:Uncharacterized protein n=1 Tax=Portunus trituberculatus TaxID=210409 RepID=A0A5B7GTV3_PORTR|nr:hypothetical protein [Portunus trituberculatus]
MFHKNTSTTNASLSSVSRGSCGSRKYEAGYHREEEEEATLGPSLGASQHALKDGSPGLLPSSPCPPSLPPFAYQKLRGAGEGGEQPGVRDAQEDATPSVWGRN